MGNKPQFTKALKRLKRESGNTSAVEADAMGIGLKAFNSYLVDGVVPQNGHLDAVLDHYGAELASAFLANLDMVAISIRPQYGCPFKDGQAMTEARQVLDDMLADDKTPGLICHNEAPELAAAYERLGIYLIQRARGLV